jgi:hypothetical protein
MKISINKQLIMQILEWAYEKTLNGIPGLDSVDDLARKFMMKEGTLHEKADSLIRWQNVKAGTSGFLTGIGGLMTLPVAIPANLASVLFIQIRMIAAIAHMGGYNLRDEKVKTLVYVCLAGNFAKDIIQETGIMIGTKLTARVVESISERSLLAINQKVGFRLVSKYGGKSAINIGKAVPLVGGLIGGTIDTVTTNLIGNTARNIFIGSLSNSVNENLK